MTTAPHLDSTKTVGRTFQSVKRLSCPQNDRLESRSHRSEEFFNTLLSDEPGAGCAARPRRKYAVTSGPGRCPEHKREWRQAD